MRMGEIEPAKLARDEALAAVSSGAKAWWMPMALEHIRELGGAGGRELTGEDIRHAIHDRLGPPHHHNAYGALVRTAVKRGYLIQTGRWTHMKDVQSHARLTPIYVTPEFN